MNLVNLPKNYVQLIDEIQTFSDSNGEASLTFSQLQKLVKQAKIVGSDIGRVRLDHVVNKLVHAQFSNLDNHDQVIFSQCQVKKDTLFLKYSTDYLQTKRRTDVS